MALNHIQFAAGQRDKATSRRGYVGVPQLIISLNDDGLCAMRPDHDRRYDPGSGDQCLQAVKPGLDTVIDDILNSLGLLLPRHHERQENHGCDRQRANGIENRVIQSEEHNINPVKPRGPVPFH